MKMVATRRNGKSKIISSSITTNNGTTKGASFKYRPSSETTRESARGKLPCAEAVSIQQVVTMMFVHICRKVLYGFDFSYRVGLYILGTLLVSVVSDYKTTAPSRSYFANPENFLNQYFVKFGWGWTLAVTGTFTFLTARTYSCGKSNIIIRNISRLGIATALWYIVTFTFQIIEQRTGVCELVKYTRKEPCVAHGFFWKGLDISGHCFLLVFSNLFIIEEGKAYLGWERIKDFLRMEEYRRIEDAKEGKETALSKLKNEEYLHLRYEYPKNTNLVRLTFCGMAVLSLFWDFMFLTTLLFHHLMIEKVVASGLAVLLWFALYKCLYNLPISPGLPGEGLFKYVTWSEPILKKGNRSPVRRNNRDINNTWTQQEDIPKFMGMPLYNLKGQQKEDTISENSSESQQLAAMSSRRGGRGSMTDLSMRPLGRARSRSQSRTRLFSKSSLNVLR